LKDRRGDDSIPRSKKSGSINVAATLFLLVIYSSLVATSIWLVSRHYDSNTGWAFLGIKLVFFTMWYVLIIMAVTRSISVSNFVRGSAYMLSTLMIVNSIYGLLELDFKLLWGIIGVGFGAIIAALSVNDVRRL
jgi:hypothetical protein